LTIVVYCRWFWLTDPEMVTFWRIFAYFDLAGLNQVPWAGLLLAESHSSGGLLVYKLVNSRGILLLRSSPRPRTCIFWRNDHSSGGFLLYELVIPSGIPIPLVDSSSKRWYCNSQQNHHLSRGGRMLAVRVLKVLSMVTISGFLTVDLYGRRIFLKNSNEKSH
jgi:hypothetical protein